MVSRRTYAALLAVIAVPLSVVSLAWACAPQGTVIVNPTGAASGAEVSVILSGFPNGVPVDVRWNGMSGPRLALGVGPAFTTTVTVPAVPAGFYVISAATMDEHATHTEGRAPFQVTVSAVAPPPPPAVAPPTPMNPFAPKPGPGGKVITGTDGADRLDGTSARDVITCGRGNDVVLAKGGDDYIDCGSGNDRVDGGGGDDEILGGSGNDNLTGGFGDDEISGSSGNDKLFGGSGADDLSGGTGIDILRGNGGRDRLSGQGGRDTLYADRLDRVVRGPGDRVIR
jgi:hypothetical protein